MLWMFRERITKPALRVGGFKDNILKIKLLDVGIIYMMIHSPYRYF